MTNSQFYLNKRIKSFIYVPDRIVWDELFNKSTPFDFCHPQRGEVVLSDYFEFTKELNSKSLLKPKKEYFALDVYLQNTIFVCLCGFMNRYNKPFIECYIYIPNHQSFPYNEFYSPFHIRYDGNGILPAINYENNRISFNLGEECCQEIMLYACAEKMEPGNYILTFPFSFFRGFCFKFHN